MRLRLALVALVFTGERCALAEEFPYRAFVNAEEVNVRSGPGENYYPVLKLARGEAVEVYRHDPGGWYAIRPPEGSCSWISGEFLALREGNVAEVTGDRVVARVGSAFSDIRDVIQVRLDRGEQVEVLEARRFAGEGGGEQQTWYKIAPPAGEFRWVAGKYLSNDSEPLTERERGPRNNLLLAGLSKRDAPGGERLATREPQAPNLPPAGRTTKPRRDASDLEDALENLDIELSAIVAEEPKSWDFRSLNARVEELLSDAETAADRGRARLLLSKISRFDDIRRRYDVVMLPPALADRLPRDPALVNRDPNVRRELLDAPRYDGSGKLAQVVSSKVGAPQYALLDANGEVRCYVTGAPGVNLRNYLGREVGINGSVGYLAEQQAQHLTAKRIVTVDDSGSTKLR